MKLTSTTTEPKSTAAQNFENDSTMVTLQKETNVESWPLVVLKDLVVRFCKRITHTFLENRI
jgi:hypothetical protein